jgi:hypothetical protein
MPLCVPSLVAFGPYSFTSPLVEGESSKCDSFPSAPDISVQLSTKWKESLGPDGSTVVNAPRFFTRYFLDVIGEGTRLAPFDARR